MVTKEIEFRMYQCEDPNSIIIGCDDIQYLNEYISKSIEIINKSDKMNISPTTNIYFMSVDETTLELYRIYNIINNDVYDTEYIDKHISEYPWYDSISDDIPLVLYNESDLLRSIDILSPKTPDFIFVLKPPVIFSQTNEKKMVIYMYEF